MNGKSCVRNLDSNLWILRATDEMNILAGFISSKEAVQELILIEPTGIERLREALEANDWEAPDPLDSADLDDFDMDDESDIDGSIGFGIPRAELEEDMFGMQRAIYAGMASAADEEEEEEEEEEDGGGEGDADEEEVEKLQTLMLRMQAVRGKYSTICPKNEAKNVETWEQICQKLRERDLLQRLSAI